MLIDLVQPIIENPIFIKYGILSLFLNSVFGAIVPFPTEITSSALLLSGQNTTLILLAMAIGSIIGGIVSYFIGYDGKKVFNLLNKIQKKDRHEKSFNLLQKYGWQIIIVASWLPFLGDIITVVAGVTKYDFKKFLISMAIGKITHAVVIVYFSNLILHYLNYFKF